MAKRKKKPTYWVDVYGSPNAEPHLRDFEKFRSLKKAVRFAIDHELPADRIRDHNGDPIPDLDLDDPQWWNHRRLETEYRNQRAAAENTLARLDLERDAYRNRQVTMIRAGYVPIELLTERLRDASISNDNNHRSDSNLGIARFMHGATDITVTLTLSGNPGALASEYKQAPFAAFLQALNLRLGQR